MLRPAHIGHLAMLRALIRDGAREGSFQPELAWDSKASERFFGELRQALRSGYFVVENRETGALQTVAVPGYVYWADESAGTEPPVGFGLFKAAPGGGYELWLAGLDTALRGKGHGRAMLKALFATATGQETRFMRVRREGRYAPGVARLLAEHGFTATRETKHETWFVRAITPAFARGETRRAH
ncbi:MAG TPA: GNAT family N-acetyltransferase [Casimicrobiaceae bacterium]|nr:GNAT family N-acetyltransferase [Casimicrobiaceae bacterium]